MHDSVVQSRYAMKARESAPSRAPVISRKTKVLAAVLAAPFVIFVVTGLAILGTAALPGFFFFTGLVIVPIGLAVWLGVRGGRLADSLLKRRRRRMPHLPVQLHGTEDQAFDVASIALPLFSRPLANLWSRAAIVHYEGVTLRLFDFVHADMLGEGSGMSSRGGLTIVSCALALVDAEMPMVVVRPRREPFTLPDGLSQYETELEEFNDRFRLFSEDAYAATAIVDQRTIWAVQGFDPGTAIEIGGPAVLVYTSRRGAWLRLVQQAAALAQTFPAVVASLFPRQ